MSETLRTSVKEWTSEKLLEEFYTKKEEYQPEALGIIEKEIEARNISNEDKAGFLTDEASIEERHLSATDFETFDHLFTQTDALIVDSILRTEDVDFFLRHEATSTVIPTETEDEVQYQLSVHRDHLEKAHELIDGYFVKTDGKYRIAYANFTERLMGFNFNGISKSPTELEEILEITFNATESRYIMDYGARILEQADRIEAEQERAIFYYDQIEDLLNRMKSPGNTEITGEDLLAIIEILQIFCTRDDFPEELKKTAEAAMDFFS